MPDPQPPLELAGLPPDTLSGRVAVVTGAGAGIGRAVARTFAALGARVVLADVSPAGEAATNEITAGGGQALFVQTDVAHEASVASLARQAQAVFGPATVLINIAAVAPVTTLAELPVAEWDRAVAVNLRGAFLTCRAFLPGMLAAGSGTIVNMIPTGAGPGVAAHLAVTQGLVGLSQSLALEVGGQGVHVVAFSPERVDPPGSRAAAAGPAPPLELPEAHPSYPGQMPAERVAAAAAYLVARLAGELNGQVTDGYTVLERAGVVSPAPAGLRPDEAPRPTTRAATPPASPDRPALLARALKEADHLRALLVQTEAEFDHLPIFVRPMARGGFKARVGLSAPEAIRAAARLIEQLHRMQARHASRDAEFDSGAEQFAIWLQRLVAYFEALPAESARLAPDEARLTDVRQIAGQRAAAVRALLAALAGLRSEAA